MVAIIIEYTVKESFRASASELRCQTSSDRHFNAIALALTIEISFINHSCATIKVIIFRYYHMTNQPTGDVNVCYYNT